MGWLQIFWVKGKNEGRKGHPDPPPPVYSVSDMTLYFLKVFVTYLIKFILHSDYMLIYQKWLLDWHNQKIFRFKFTCETLVCYKKSLIKVHWNIRINHNRLFELNKNKLWNFFDKLSILKLWLFGYKRLTSFMLAMGENYMFHNNNKNKNVLI